MKTEVKTAVIILLTLLIGIIIGSLLTGAIARYRVRRFVSMRDPGPMSAHIERMIQPDASQREAVREILDKHAERFAELNSQFHDQLMTLRDSLRKDLDPILTDEQKARLERGPKPPKHLMGGRPDHHPIPQGKRSKFPPRETE